MRQQFTHILEFYFCRSFSIVRKWWTLAQKQKKAPSETKIKSKLRQVELSAGFPNEAIVEAYMKPVVDESQEDFTWAKPNIDLLTEYPFDTGIYHSLDFCHHFIARKGLFTLSIYECLCFDANRRRFHGYSAIFAPN